MPIINFAIKDDIKFLLSLLPTWVKEVPAGFDPTMYGTGSYVGDLKVNKRVREIEDRYDVNGVEE